MKIILSLGIVTICSLLLEGCRTHYSPEESAAKYCEALNAQEYTKLPELFHQYRIDTAKIYAETKLYSSFLREFLRISQPRCSVVPKPSTVRNGYRVVLDFQNRLLEHSTKRVLYVTKRGLIVYDPVLSLIPAVEAASEICGLRSQNSVIRAGSTHTIKNLKVPLFGYNPQAEESIRNASINKIEQWFKENFSSSRFQNVIFSPAPTDKKNIEALMEECKKRKEIEQSFLKKSVNVRIPQTGMPSQ